MYRTLPFGLNVAPCEFTKVVGSVIQLLGKEGILLFFYLDDIIILASNPDTAIQWTSEEKSILMPTQKIEHLGVVFDFENGRHPNDREEDGKDPMTNNISRTTIENNTLGRSTLQ